MSEAMATSQWIQFFMKSGLPPNVAANYAIIFSDNRIQLNMLMDLSKEYLYDMGIRVMGDVIAILRYAKEYHTQLVKERVIGTAPSRVIGTAPSGVIGTAPSRVIGTEPARVIGTAPSRVIGTAPSTDKTVRRILGHYTKPSAISVRKSFPSNQGQSVPKKSAVISFGKVPIREPYVKRIRKVAPEEEGAYKIKMPDGTTERSRKILQQQKQLQATKRSVFHRLGESAVSSSTDTKKSSSVFKRLGPSSDDAPSSTSEAKSPSSVQYHRVKMAASLSLPAHSLTRTVIHLTQTRPTANASNIRRINSILSANDTSKIIGRRLGVPSRRMIGQTAPSLNIKSRLGDKPFAGKKVSHSARNRIVVNKLSNVFDRLGN